VIIYHEARIGDSLFTYKKEELKKIVPLKLKKSYDFLDDLQLAKTTIPTIKYEIRVLSL
jgi:hypothetical protein